ncbi:MAG: LemA family protein [Planctomycetota bacterium]
MPWDRPVPDQLLWIVAAVLVVGVGLATLLAWLERRAARRSWIWSRAPELPVHVLSVWDDAWIRGAIRCPEPLQVPWFELPCVWYDYLIERKVTTSWTDSKGRRHTSSHWTTDHHFTYGIPFELEGERASITVVPEDIQLEDSISLGYDYEHFSRRHSARIVPVDHAATLCGVKREDGTFGPHGEVPLTLAFRRPEDLLKGAERKRWWLRFSSMLLCFLAPAGAMALWDSGLRAEPRWALVALVGFAGFLPLWFLHAYNRLVRERQEVDAAWSQVSVDLAARDDLIPNLVAVVKGYAGHEREVLELAARLRSGGGRQERIENDRVAAELSRRILLLAEAYPDLEANEQYASLHERLWALEEKLAASRRFYNTNVREWNDLVQAFPTNLVASLFAWKPSRFFWVRRGERRVPRATVAGPADAGAG